MTTKKIALGVWALSMGQYAWAIAVPLGDTAVRLPLVEGGLLTVAVAGLVAGVRIVRAKHKQKR